MTPRQRVLKRIEEAQSDLLTTIQLYYARVASEGRGLNAACEALKRDDLKALRYLVRKAKG